jgi:hypothetical protein
VRLDAEVLRLLAMMTQFFRASAIRAGAASMVDYTAEDPVPKLDVFDCGTDGYDGAGAFVGCGAGEGGPEDAGVDHAVGVAEGGGGYFYEEVVRGEGEGGGRDAVDGVRFVELDGGGRSVSCVC